jgi:hypothetical protein
MNRMSVVWEREQDRIADSRASAIVAPPTKIRSRAASLLGSAIVHLINGSRGNALNLDNSTLLLMLLPVRQLNRCPLPIQESCSFMVGEAGNEAVIRLELDTHAAVSCIWQRMADYMVIYQVCSDATMVYHEAAVSHTEQPVQTQDRASP